MRPLELKARIGLLIYCRGQTPNPETGKTILGDNVLTDSEVVPGTVQRYFLGWLQRRARQEDAPVCPKILGIEEHFLTRRKRSPPSAT
jgi:hypothetical protein